MRKIKVLIVDDQALMRDGLKTILENSDEIEVVGTARNGIEALDIVELIKPDLVLMDIRMEKMDGVECTKIIKNKYPHIVVLLLTTFNDEEYIIDALKYKAGGYILKDIESNKLIEAIKYAADGNLIMPQRVANKLSKRILNENKTECNNTKSKTSIESNESNIGLSQLETEISNLMLEGYTNKQIASVLHLTHGTVKNYVSQIYNKIGVNDRVNAVMYLKKYINV